jgi:hypothetical protein
MPFYCAKMRKGKHRSKKPTLTCAVRYASGETRFFPKGNINCPEACDGGHGPRVNRRGKPRGY